MAKRGDNKSAKQRRLEREKQRRQAAASREPGLVPGIDPETVRRALVADSKSRGGGHGADQPSCDDGSCADHGRDLELYDVSFVLSGVARAGCICNIRAQQTAA